MKNLRGHILKISNHNQKEAYFQLIVLSFTVRKIEFIDQVFSSFSQVLYILRYTETQILIRYVIYAYPKFQIFVFELSCNILFQVDMFSMLTIKHFCPNFLEFRVTT